MVTASPLAGTSSYIVNDTTGQFRKALKADLAALVGELPCVEKAKVDEAPPMTIDQDQREGSWEENVVVRSEVWAHRHRLIHNMRVSEGLPPRIGPKA